MTKVMNNMRKRFVSMDIFSQIIQVFKVSVYYIALASTVTGTEFENKKKIKSLINFIVDLGIAGTFSKIKKFHFNDLTVQ